MVETQGGKKKSSFLDKVASAFVSDVPEFSQQQPQQAAPAAPLNPGYIAPAQTSSGRAAFDEKSRARLTDALQAEKLDSYDYLKFKAAVSDTANDIPDEKVRFKSAFAAAKSMGITKDKLIETAKHYLLVLGDDLKRFNQDLDGKIASRLDGDTKRVTDMDASVEAKRVEIAKINQDIETIQRERNALASQISDDRTKIESGKSSYLSVQAEMVSDINNDIDKLSRFLA